MSLCEILAQYQIDAFVVIPSEQQICELCFPSGISSASENTHRTKVLRLVRASLIDDVDAKITTFFIFEVLKVLSNR